jgi:hypothetical protein
VFVSGYLTWRNVRIAQENLAVTQQGHITDRFTKAIDQLGATNVEVRVGGIYALGRIAEDSPRGTMSRSWRC